MSSTQAKPTSRERRRVVETLQAAVRHATVTGGADEDFAALHATLREAYPLLHSTLERIELPDSGLLFRWHGRSDEQPVLLMAHQDVVAIDPLTTWTHDPFSADVIDEYLWGRGTLDDKGALVTICEAVERLIERGFVPRHDVLLFFGCDEESTGQSAKAAATELHRRGIQPWLVLDEGGAVAADAFPGVRAPIAVVGVSEKGSSLIELRVDGGGGHSSTPGKNEPTVRLAKAIVAIENNPMPARLIAPTLTLVKTLATQAARPQRALLSAAARTPALLLAALQRAGAEPAAMTRTTLTVTELSGAPGPNIIAGTAVATVNARILIGDSVDGVVDHLRKAINDRHVGIRVTAANEPSPLSPTSGPQWDHLTATIGAVFPDATCAPYVMMAATDSRSFTDIARHVYRFAPLRMSKAQRESIHGVDERVALTAIHEAVDFYQRFIENLPDQ